MSLQRLFRWLRSTPTAAPHAKCRPSLRVERLEDRLTPALSVTDLTGGVTATQMVQSLVGNGIQVSNVKYTGAPVASGNFSGGSGIIGFNQGIVLTSGSAKGVIGPNNQSGFTLANNTPGDSQLDTIVAPNPTLDAAVLEFDFVPQGGVLNFKYVFGSEEYPEFVGSPFNDVFAFYLNGTNVALIPGTNTPVAINTVNAGSNAQFFVDNYTNTSAFDTQLDGFTKVLTVTANVNVGQTNHIKLAIADTSDQALDSAVFIQAGSFAAPKAPVLKVYNPVRFIYNAKTNTYDGLFTLINVGNGVAKGPSYVIFTKLPTGASIANASGSTSGGSAYLTLNADVAPKQVIHLLVKIKNPLHQPLAHFYFHSNVKFSATAPA